MLPYIPQFQHLLTDLSGYTDEQIRGEVWLRVGLLVLKHIFDNNLGEQLPRIFGLMRDLAQQESGLEMLRTVLLYIAEANEKVTAEQFEQGVLATTLPEGGKLMATLAQKWKDEGRVEGLEAGVAAQRETFLRFLAWRFHPGLKFFCQENL